MLALFEYFESPEVKIGSKNHTVPNFVRYAKGYDNFLNLMPENSNK